MKKPWIVGMALSAALLAVALPYAACAADQVVIGDIDDMSGVYADVEGAGGVEAMNMAIADFGGSVLGRKIVTLSADHQNKPDIGASKFREWADQNGLNVLMGGSNTGVNIAMAKVAAAKKVPMFTIGAGGASPDAGPRGSFLFDMHFFMNAARSAPCRCWSSAPNLQVASLSFCEIAKDGALGSITANVAATMAVRSMLATPRSLRG